MRAGPNQPTKALSPVLLAATTETLRRLGPRRFSLTAVAEGAGVSRGTVHNALGSRENAIKTALDHLAAAFVETMAAEVEKSDTLAEKVSAAAVLICAHRKGSDSVSPRSINEVGPGACSGRSPSFNGTFATTSKRSESSHPGPPTTWKSCT